MPIDIADGSAGDFSFRYEGADVVFGSVGVDRDFRAVENAQEPVLVLKQPSEQPVERDVACAGAFEDTVETGAQEANTLKHAFSSDVVGKMKLQLRRLGDTFEMTMLDDGGGFDPDTTQLGRGIELMGQIAQQLGGTLRFERLPVGMMVRLTFPASVKRQLSAE